MFLAALFIMSKTTESLHVLMNESTNEDIFVLWNTIPQYKGKKLTEAFNSMEESPKHSINMKF